MRVRGLHGSYFMKGSWCDTDRGRRRKRCWNVLHREKLDTGRDVVRQREGREERWWAGWSCGWTGEWRVGGEEAKVLFNDRKVRLTVGHTLILDLQVFVGSRAGVREDVWTRDHDTLGPVVAPGSRKMKNLTRRVRDSPAEIFMLTYSSYLTLLAL